jgi:hypothetical protein
VAVVVALVAVAAANAALLVYSGDRHDPVGQLSPIANVQQPQPRQPAPPVPRATDPEDD